jgi:SAM-dependent methyltransferase
MRRYDNVYREFDSPLMRRIRREAYGEDIGQHSWVRADEFRRDAARLGLSASSQIVDLGCGPCGPLAFILAETGCSGTGVELSHAALRAGRARAAALGVGSRVALARADLNEHLPLQSGAFDAVMSLDVVLHLRDRAGFFREAARALRPGGLLLLTDAGVLTGSLTAEEEWSRGLYGSIRLVPPGVDEHLLDEAGFGILAVEDRTESVLKNARGRLVAIEANRKELARLWPGEEFERQLSYLETVIEMYGRGALTRVMVLAETPGRL